MKILLLKNEDATPADIDNFIETAPVGSSIIVADKDNCDTGYFISEGFRITSCRKAIKSVDTAVIK